MGNKIKKLNLNVNMRSSIKSENGNWWCTKSKNGAFFAGFIFCIYDL